MTRVLLFLLRVYKVAFSPFVGAQCRFLPTCSDYARDAVIAHGPAYGSYLAAKRLCRCHPFAQPTPRPRGRRFTFPDRNPTWISNAPFSG
jgi:putative membrane protein insertion efficiency factor